MNEITNVMNGETKEKILDLVANELPGAQATLFQRYMENSERLKADLQSAEIIIKAQTTDACDKDNKISELREKIKILEELKLDRKAVDAREVVVSKREMVLDHKEMIADLQLNNATSQKDLVLGMFNTVFKPATLRKEVQRQVGRVCRSGQVMQYNEQGKQVPTDGGEYVDDSEEKDTTEITEE